MSQTPSQDTDQNPVAVKPKISLTVAQKIEERIQHHLDNIIRLKALKDKAVLWDVSHRSQDELEEFHSFFL